MNVEKVKEIRKAAHELVALPDTPMILIRELCDALLESPLDNPPSMNPQKRIAELETALKVIHTWASLDKEEGLENCSLKHRALKSDFVIELCEKVLKGYHPAKKG